MVVEEKSELMRKMGTKQLSLELHEPLPEIPASLGDYDLTISGGGCQLVYTYDTQSQRTGITALLKDLGEAGIRFRDLNTEQSSLEDIFVGLVKEQS